MNTAVFPRALTPRLAHFIIRAQQARDELNKGAGARGSLTVETPAAQQGQEGTLCGCSNLLPQSSAPSHSASVSLRIQRKALRS